MSELRNLRVEDAEQVAALFVEAFGKARRLDAEEIRTWIDNKELKPEHLRVLEENGVVVGYGDIWIEDDEVALDVAAPGHWETIPRLGRGGGSHPGRRRRARTSRPSTSSSRSSRRAATGSCAPRTRWRSTWLKRRSRRCPPASRSAPSGTRTVKWCALR